MYDVVWLPGEALVATCRHRKRSWRRPWHELPSDHGAPDERCNCGIYGADRRKAIRPYERLALPNWAVGRVVGHVALWGDVLECDRGWRASHAYPGRLCSLRASRSWRGSDGEGLLEMMLQLDAYGVPVEVADEPRQNLPWPLLR